MDGRSRIGISGWLIAEPELKSDAGIGARVGAAAAVVGSISAVLVAEGQVHVGSRKLLRNAQVSLSV